MKLNFMGVNLQTLVIKSLAIGVGLGLLAGVVGAIVSNVNNAGQQWLQYVVMIAVGFGLIFAMKFRKGTENIFEALISLVFVYAFWGLVSTLIKFNPIKTFTVSSGLTETVLFLALFFTAEGITQRVLKNMKLI